MWELWHSDNKTHYPTQQVMSVTETIPGLKGANKHGITLFKRRVIKSMCWKQAVYISLFTVIPDFNIQLSLNRSVSHSLFHIL